MPPCHDYITLYFFRRYFHISLRVCRCFFFDAAFRHALRHVASRCYAMLIRFEIAAENTTSSSTYIIQKNATYHEANVSITHDNIADAACCRYFRRRLPLLLSLRCCRTLYCASLITPCSLISPLAFDDAAIHDDNTSHTHTSHASRNKALPALIFVFASALLIFC